MFKKSLGYEIMLQHSIRVTHISAFKCFTAIVGKKYREIIYFKISVSLSVFGHLTAFRLQFD